MRIQRMQWAGVLLDDYEKVIMIDPVFKSFNEDFFGEPREQFYDFKEFKKPDTILITHLHSDHFDPGTILQSFGENCNLVVPKVCVDEVKTHGFKKVTGLEIGDSIKIGEFELFAEISVDGLGDPQVSWVIKNKEKTYIHCGDTLWHGHWWRIAKQYGPIDIAFLPINAAIIQDEDMVPSNQPICLSPEQAISAATILNVKFLIPIHFGAFHNPPNYNQTEYPLERLVKNDKEQKVKVLKNKEDFHFIKEPKA